MLSRRCKSGGFSLVELAIAVTIMGLIVAVALQTYQYYAQNSRITNTATSQSAIAPALSNFLFNFGYLPCPAGPGVAYTNAGLGNPGAGEATGYPDGAGSLTCAQFVAAHFTPGTPYCDNNAASATYRLCIIDGARISPANGGGSKDPVLIGSVPYQTLGLPFSASLDGWGNRFIYAVSYYDTQSTYVQSGTWGGVAGTGLGAINLQKYSRAADVPPGNDLAAILQGQYGPTGAAVTNAFPLVVFSVGPDGKGAFSAGGNIGVPCTGLGRDVVNCNNAPWPGVGAVSDASTFTQPGAVAVPDSVIYSTAAGAEHYDDQALLASVQSDADKWSFSSQTAMENKTGGKVGIGTQSPGQELDVKGNILANNAQAQTFCDATNSNCFPQQLVGFSQCTGTDLLTGIANGQIICNQAVNVTGLTGPAACVGNTVLAGFNADGSLNCQP